MSESFDPIPPHTEAAATAVIEAAFKVHRALGPGLLESIYEVCLCHELSKCGVHFQRQQTLPVIYDNVRLDSGLRLDLIIEEAVIVELKSVDRLTPLFDAQVLTYLKLSGKRLGILINFNVPRLKDGIKRLIR